MFAVGRRLALAGIRVAKSDEVRGVCQDCAQRVDDRKLILQRDNDLENRWAEYRVDSHALPVANW